MKNQFLFFLIVIISLFSLPLASATVVGDLNLSLLTSPALVGVDQNFNLSWQGASTQDFELHWALDSNITIPDLSGNGRAVSTIGTVDLNTDIFIRGTGSLHFNNTAGSNVRLNDYNFNVQQAFTMSIWVYPDINGTSMMAFWNGDEAGNGFGGDSEVHLGTGFGGNVGQFEFYIDAVGGDDCQAIDPTSFATGQWHLLTGTFDGTTTCELFVNGVSVDTDGITLPDMNGFSGITYLGRPGSTSSSRFWSGNLDDARLWDRQLGDTDINGLFNAADPSRIYWQFNTDGNVLQSADNNVNNFFSDDFDDNNIDGWGDVSTFSASNQQLVGTTNTATISHANDFNFSGNSNAEFVMSFDANFANTSTTSAAIAFNIVDANAIASSASSNGYRLNLQTNSSGTITFSEWTAASETVLFTQTGVSMPQDTYFNYNLSRANNGDWSLVRTNLTSLDSNTFFEGVNDVTHTDLNTTFINTAGTVTMVALDNFDYNTVNTVTLFTSQSQEHTFTSTGTKTVFATVQNPDGNTSTSLDFNVFGALNILVFDENKGTVIPSATVTFDGNTFVTGVDGNVLIGLTNLTAGEFTINVDVNSDFPIRNFTFDLNQFSAVDLNFLMLETNDGATRSYTIFQPDQTTLITNSLVEWRRTITIPNGISQRTRTDSSGQLDFFGQQDANYVMRITDEVAGGLVRDYNGTIVTVKIPLNLEDITQTLTPFSIDVGGLAALSLTGLTTDTSFKIFSDTTNFYTVTVDANTDFFGTNFLVKTLGGQATLSLQPHLVPVTGNLESIITTLSNGTQRKTITDIRIESRTNIGGSLTLVESKISDITGTAAFHFEIGRQYELSFFDTTGRLIFIGVLVAKTSDTQLFAFLQEARLDVQPTLVGNVIITWIPSTGNLKPVDQNVTVTQLLSSFNITIGDVNVIVSSVNDNNVFYSQLFSVNATDVNLTYDINVSSITNNSDLLGIRLDIFDVNGVLIQQAQSSKYTLFPTDIIDGADLIKTGLGTVLSAFLAVIISFIVIAFITNGSIGEDLNFIGIGAFLLTGAFVMFGFIAFNTWAFATLLSIGLMLLGRTK